MGPEGTGESVRACDRHEARCIVAERAQSRAPANAEERLECREGKGPRDQF